MGDKGLPWSWVIEALASSELVDIGLLYELGPQLVGDSRMAAREAAALRCLERLCASTIHVNNLNLNHSQLLFDPTQTCQDILRCVWQQTGHLQINAPEELKWSIHSFVKHKKAAFPSCTLTLLKNMILEGSHTFLEEVNGLSIPSNCSGNPVYPQSTHLKKVNRCSLSPEIDDQLGDVKNPNASSGNSKSGTNGCCIEDHTQGIDSVSDELGNLPPPAKKLKLQKQDSVSSDAGKFSDGIEDNIANRIGGRESLVKTVGRPAKTYAQSYHLPQISPVDGECRPRQTLAHMSKTILSSSHCEFNEDNEDSIALTDTEINLCMKCNEGSQLLSCCGSTCPLLFHESCLGGFVSFNDRSNFYCPICAYSRAVSDYAKANKKVSLLRKEFTLFIGGCSNNQPKHDHSRSFNDNVYQERHENRENATGLQNDADAVQVTKSH